jgi:hypothetical protein
VGEIVYESSCEGCHTLEYLVTYLEGDGKFSELAHKGRWGIPDTDMTRRAMDYPTADHITNLLFFLQNLGETGFNVNPGLTGTWYDAARAGEGWLLEVGFIGGAKFMFASFYTYDTMGNQTYLLAESTEFNGDSAEMVVYMTEGAMWGADFNPDDVARPLWGTATFTFPGCGGATVELRANDEAKAQGFTDMTTDLTRLLDSGIACPTPE